MQPMVRRPPAVTAAVYLLYLIAGAQLVSGFLGVVLLNDVREAYEAAYGGVAGRGPAKVAVVVGAVMGVLLALGYSLLGYLNGRGRNGARITTWVILGGSLCCFGGGVLYRYSPTEPRVTSTYRASRTEITQSISDIAPAYASAMFMLSLLSLAAAIMVLIVLALPPANQFFRRPRPQPHPMQPYPGQPYPGQPYPGPQSSGQPHPGQPYPGQPYPGQQFPGQQPPGYPYPGQQFRQ